MKRGAPQTAQQRIISYLNRRKNPATKAQIAERTLLPLGTVKRTVFEMQQSGLVASRGTVRTGKRGRPAVLFSLTA